MSTQVSDNFTGADGALGVNWASVIPNSAESQANALTGGILVRSHAYGPINAGGGDAAALWTGNSFGNDQWAQSVIKTVAPYTSVVAITAAVNNGDGTTTYTYTLSSGAALASGQPLNISGMADAGNNNPPFQASFIVSSLGVGTFTVSNSAGVTRALQSGVGVSPSDSGAGVIVRGSGTTAGTLTAYFFHIGTNSYSGDGRVAFAELWKVVNGVGTFFLGQGNTGRVIPTVGEVLALSAVGTTITAYLNGVQVFQVTDSSIASGVPGIWSWSMNGTDEFVWSAWTTVVNPPGNNGTSATAFQAGDTPFGGVMSILASDDFNRAGPALGSNWTPVVGSLSISSHKLAANSGGNRSLAFWNANGNTVPADQWATLKIPTMNVASLEGPGIALRCDNIGGGNGYVAHFIGFGGGDIQYGKIVNGTFTLFNQIINAWSPGDILGMSVVGSLISITQNSIVIGTQTDTDLVAGSLGISGYSSGTDNLGSPWDGGDFLPPPAPSSIAATSETQGFTGNVTITGTGFTSTSTVSFSGTGITVNSYGTRNSTTIIANITITSGATASARDVVMTNPDLQTGTLAAGFTVTAASSLNLLQIIATSETQIYSGDPPVIGTLKVLGALIH